MGSDPAASMRRELPCTVSVERVPWLWFGRPPPPKEAALIAYSWIPGLYRLGAPTPVGATRFRPVGTPATRAATATRYGRG